METIFRVELVEGEAKRMRVQWTADAGTWHVWTDREDLISVRCPVVYGRPERTGKIKLAFPAWRAGSGGRQTALLFVADRRRGSPSTQLEVIRFDVTCTARGAAECTERFSGARLGDVDLGAVRAALAEKAAPPLPAPPRRESPPLPEPSEAERPPAPRPAEANRLEMPRLALGSIVAASSPRRPPAPTSPGESDSDSDSDSGSDLVSVIGPSPRTPRLARAERPTDDGALPTPRANDARTERPTDGALPTPPRANDDALPTPRAESALASPRHPPGKHAATPQVDEGPLSVDEMWDRTVSETPGMSGSAALAALGALPPHRQRALLGPEPEGYDFCFVFPINDKEQGTLSDENRRIVQHLKKARFDVHVFYSVEKDKVLCKLRAQNLALLNFADAIDFKLKLDPAELERVSKTGNIDAQRRLHNIEEAVLKQLCKPFEINADPAYSKEPPFEHIYGQYDTNIFMQDLYHKADGEKLPVRGATRLQLIRLMIEAERPVGAGVSPLKLVSTGDILGFFPLHDPSALQAVSDAWDGHGWPWQSPIGPIREYFGEVVALYFCFLGHYSAWLCPLALLGTATSVWIVAAWKLLLPITYVFTGAVPLWAVVMLERWKRTQSRRAMEWGMVGFEEDEHNRPEFRGETIVSYVDGRDMLYYPPRSKKKKARLSFALTIFLICLVLALILGVFMLRIFIVKSYSWGTLWGPIIAACANSLQINVMTAVYGVVAMWLNDRENWKTDTEYQDNLITKMFAFEFCNQYAPLYYYAFLARRQSEIICDSTDSCMMVIAQYNLIMLLCLLFVGNAIEVVLPMLATALKGGGSKAGAEAGTADSRAVSVAESEFNLEPYDAVLGPLQDYLELAIQFGFNVLFAASLPVAPLLSLAAMRVEISIDSFKLLKLHQRPLPRGAEDIGSWANVYSLLAAAGIPTNAGLLIYTMDAFPDLTTTQRAWLFNIVIYVMFTIMVGLSVIMPDEPKDVVTQRQRQEFLVDKVVRQTLDEADDDDGAGTDLVTPRDASGARVPLDIDEHDDGPPQGVELAAVR